MTTVHEPTVLRDMFFHSFEIEDGNRAGFKWQGTIADVIVESARHYLVVDLFDWVVGSWSSRQLVSFEQVVDEQWEFHDSAEAMRQYYEVEGRHE